MRTTWAIALGLCACGPTSLGGSLTEIMKLQYTSAQVRTNAAGVSVRFISPQGTGENVVLEVAANLSGTQLSAGNAIDLTELATEGTQRGQVSRNVLNDPRTTFPTLARGFLRLDELPIQGQSVDGAFSVTFAEGIDAASGRTAFGSFNASVP